MSCGTCGIQASDTMQGDTGVPAGAPTAQRGRCPRCRAFVSRAGGPCRNPRCPLNQGQAAATPAPAGAAAVPAPPGPSGTPWTLVYFTPEGECASQAVVFQDGHLNADSKHTVAVALATEELVRGAEGCTAEMVVLAPDQHEGMLAMHITTAEEGGYVVVTDQPLPAALGQPQMTAASCGVPADRGQFYAYCFPYLDGRGAAFESHYAEEIARTLWANRERTTPLWGMTDAERDELLVAGRSEDEYEQDLAYHKFRAVRWGATVQRLLAETRGHLARHVPQKFPLGQTAATPAALDALDQEAAAIAAQGGHVPAQVLGSQYFRRHQAGDWGYDQTWGDLQRNENALREGDRLHSVYTLPVTGQVIWLITEWDRSVTTLLLPSDY